jgi:carboxyl-terminal processing protease
MNNKSSIFVPFLLMVFMTIGLFIGYKLNKNDLPQNATSSTYGKINDIMDLLDHEYVDSINKNKLFEETISDMLHELDPHSNYIPARDIKAVNEQIDGKFGGVGIRFAVIRDTLCVTNVVPNSPAQRAGLKSGDRVISIDGKKVASKKLKNEEYMAKLKGDPNTKVQVTIYRDQQTLKKALIRDIIPITSIVCAQMLDQEIGYIRLDNFSVTSAEEFKFAAVQLLRKGMKKLIFDLRDNGGGVLDGAVKIADEFLPTGMNIVEVRGKRFSNTMTKSRAGGLLEETELVVLINENSASASEILAGAIQDNDRGMIVGRRSFGKGLVQQDFTLRDKSNLRLTIARYYTPSGRSIQRPFSDSYEEYYHDRIDRQKNGEYFKPDSSVFKNAKAYQTRNGRTVYGGGGIMPDYFVALDTSNSTIYYLNLRYSGAFQHVAFDFVSNKRNQYQNLGLFNKTFKVDDLLLKKLTQYASSSLKVPFKETEFNRSKELIRLILKAEIARQLFIEEGYFLVQASGDNEVKKALQLLKRS